MDHPVGSHNAISAPLFFIIGRPRSGTTLLRFLFEAHPHVLIPPESPFILNLYKKYRDVTLWDKATIARFCDDVYEQRYFDKWLVDKEHLHKKLTEAGGPATFQTMVKQVCMAYTSVYEKGDIRWIGDKNPGYSLYVRRIHQLFPKSRIIHITRDYRDNYLSLIKVNFEVPLVPLVVYRWKFAWRCMEKLRKRHPELICSLRYEDLARDPGNQFAEVCHFLGVPYDPAVMSFYTKKAEVEKAYANAGEITTVHQSLFHPISTERINRWEKEMSARDIRIADMVAGKTAERAGYQRQCTSFRPDLYLWILPTLIYGWIMYRLVLLGDRLPYRMRNALNRILGIFLKVYWKFNKRAIKPL